MTDWIFRILGARENVVYLGARGHARKKKRARSGAEMGTPPGPQEKRSRPRNAAPAVIRATFSSPRRLSPRLQGRLAIVTGEVRGMGVPLDLHETRAFARKIPRAGWEPEQCRIGIFAPAQVGGLRSA